MERSPAIVALSRGARRSFGSCLHGNREQGPGVLAHPAPGTPTGTSTTGSPPGNHCEGALLLRHSAAVLLEREFAREVLAKLEGDRRCPFPVRRDRGDFGLVILRRQNSRQDRGGGYEVKEARTTR